MTKDNLLSETKENEDKAQNALGLKDEYSVYIEIPITGQVTFNQQVKASSKEEAEKIVRFMLKSKTAQQLKSEMPQVNHSGAHMPVSRVQNTKFNIQGAKCVNINKMCKGEGKMKKL